MSKAKEQKKHYVYQGGKEIVENGKKILSQKTSNMNDLERKKKKAWESNLLKNTAKLTMHTKNFSKGCQFKTSLRDVPIFKNLSTKELKNITTFLKERAFSKGEILHLVGDECEYIIIVQSGRVKMFRTALSGKEQIMEILEPGDTCACNPGSCSWNCFASAQALTDCQIWLLHRNNYVRLIQNNPKISCNLNQHFAKRNCRYCSIIEDISLNNTKERVIKFLIDIHENNMPQNTNGGLLHISFTREEIAQKVGMARETVIRHLNQLMHLKLIDINCKEIIILDKKELLKFLSGEQMKGSLI